MDGAIFSSVSLVWGCNEKSAVKVVSDTLPHNLLDR